MSAWPARQEILRRHVVEPAAALAVFAAYALVVGLTGGWGDAPGRVAILVVAALALIAMGGLGALERSRTRFRAKAASPLPEHFEASPGRALFDAALAQRLAVAAGILVVMRLLFPDAVDGVTTAITWFLILGSFAGTAAGTVLAVRAYERERGRVLYVTEEGLRAPLFWGERGDGGPVPADGRAGPNGWGVSADGRPGR